MTDVSSFAPDWVSPPGDTIADILGRRNWSMGEFARQIGRSEHYVTDLVRGGTEIDDETAACLSAVLGASPAFWINRERVYRKAVSRLEVNSNTAQQGRWVDAVLLSEMKRYGWLDFASGTPDSGVQCLRFFGVDTVDAWKQRCDDLLKLANFRTSQAYRSDPVAVATWLRQAELQASEIQCKPWNPTAFRAVLANLRGLTRIDAPKIFYPQLQQACAECGVAVVVVKAPTQCKASGASWILSRNMRALVLSTRYRTNDQFWFTFFHEVGHLLLHSTRTLIIDEIEGGNGKSQEEIEANKFAEDILVPPTKRGEMLSLPVDARRVMRFAKNLGIAPGIVVGQLHHAGRFTYKQLASLKKSLDWDLQ